MNARDKEGNWGERSVTPGDIIFVTGLTSLRLGSLEFRNLGNYLVVKPLFRHLREYVPDCRIVTTLQLTAGFCRPWGIKTLKDRRYWNYGRCSFLTSVVDVLRLALWRLSSPVFGKWVQWLIDGSQMLATISDASVIVDFSGDRYGDNVDWWKFLEQNARLIMAWGLGKPTFVMAGSPGPFSGFLKRLVARYVLNRVTVITNREPISTKMLKEVGVHEPPVVTTACPSFLFDASEEGEDKKILGDDKIREESSSPLVGLILCDLNMQRRPLDKLPRAQWELEPFLKLLEMLTQDIGAQVWVMSHENDWTPEGGLAPGPDHIIIRQLLELAEKKLTEGQIRTLAGCYDATTSRRIIGGFDMLVSGRTHGAVQGLTQAIPTVMVDYAVGPPAHKLRGFARLVGIENYLCSPKDPAGMLDACRRTWERREQMQRHLKDRVHDLQARALHNFEMLAEVAGERV